MSRIDIVIFGATGFTGKNVVVELVRVSKKYPGLTWAIAGRSQSKLEELRSEVSKKTDEDLASVKIILADANDEKSLKKMCAQAKVLINCCGPYIYYGEPVVRAAIESKAHYVDISCESQFMETIQMKYDQQARDAGVYVISACGFDSIPNDMGVVFLQQNFNGTLNTVESYLNITLATKYQKEAVRTGIVHYATWESLIHSLAHTHESVPLRKKLFPEQLSVFKPKLQRRGLHILFPGAANSVTYRTQRYMYENEKKRPIQFKAYIMFESWFTTFMTIIIGTFLFVMLKTKFTTKLLLEYPRLFTVGLVTKNCPSEVLTNNTHFTFELHGRGWEEGADVDFTQPDKKITAQVVGVNPAYGTTVTALVYSALTVLTQQDKMPSAKGVLTAGAAFKNTRLIQHLNENNLIFKIISK